MVDRCMRTDSSYCDPSRNTRDRRGSQFNESFLTHLSTMRFSLRPRQVIFKLHWYGDKENIWNASRKQKDSRIFLSENVSAVVKQRQNILLPIMKAARAQGKMASLSVDNLFIEGTEYTINCLDKLPSELDPKHNATCTYCKITAFFSSASPLSNFHPAKITNDNGTVSDNVEHKYQENGAEFLDDVGAVAVIKVAKTAFDCYQAGRKIKATPEKFNSWYTTQAKEDMYQIVLKKFQQIPTMKAFLLVTGETKIIEANANDKRWGGEGWGLVSEVLIFLIQIIG